MPGLTRNSWFRAVLFSLSLLPGRDLMAQETFTVAIYYPQVPPYMYAAEDNVPTGVVPELLNAFFASQPYRLKYVFENRYRAELGLYEGKYDASVLAEKWTMQPQQLLFSQPIVAHRDYLYALEPFNREAQSLNNKTICLRRHYIYSALQPQLERGDLLRIDSESEFDQFNMLLNKRCQLAYMNEHVASWLINNRFAGVNFHRQQYATDKADLTLALNGKWSQLKPRLDAFIREAHRNGLIDRSLARHMRKTATILP
mgnify:CR=1 FL=1